MSLLLIFLCAGLSLWLASLAWQWRNRKGFVSLSAAADYPLQQKPFVSLIVPARNEAEVLGKSLPRFLALDYDNYEVILVDDASTDGTAEIARRFAVAYPARLRVIRVDRLPPDWAGKPHALHVAFQQAKGDWVLAVDADILLHPKALRAGLWVAEQRRADLVSLFAFLEFGSFWEKLLLPTFGIFLSAAFPMRKVNDPNSTVALACGNYVLLRREMWARLGGYEAIRGEIIDDLNTARIVKHSGHPIFLGATPDLARTRMYNNFRELWEGLRKHAFAGQRFSVLRLLLGVCGILLLYLLPLFGLVDSGAVVTGFWPAGAPAEPWGVFALSVAQYALAALSVLPVLAFYGIRRAYAFLAPVGAILYAAIALDAMIRTLAGDGVSWKLRSYGRPPVATEE